MSTPDDEEEISTFTAEGINLNCGEVPKLTDFELNQISDDVNYICDQLLFPDVMKETNKKYRVVLDRHVGDFIRHKQSEIDFIKRKSKNWTSVTEDRWGDFQCVNFEFDDDQRKLLEDFEPYQPEYKTMFATNVCPSASSDANKHMELVSMKMDKLLFPQAENPVVVDKFKEFESALERLSDNLETLNGKKDSIQSAMSGMRALIISYIIYIVIIFYMYIKYLFFDDDADMATVERYNIGFVTQLTYTTLVYRFSLHYENYFKIAVTEGDLDSGVCGDISRMIDNIRTIHGKLRCYIYPDQNTDKDCRNAVLLAMYHLYESKYVQNVFIAAKSEYREAVNSVNGFVEKQRKFLLKENNVDVNFTADNESLEQVYDVLLHNAGASLMKGTRTATERRNALFTQYGQANYDAFLQDKVLDDLLSILSDTKPSTENTDKLKSLVTIISELKKESLLEYFDILDVVFAIDTAEYFRYNKETYVRNSFEQIKNIAYTAKHEAYFDEVKEKYRLTNTISFDTGGAIDKEVSKSTMLTKVQSRKSNELQSQRAYGDFQKNMRSSLLAPEDISENGDYVEVFETIKAFFEEVTVEYRLTKTIVMTFFTEYVKNDEEFSADPTMKTTVISNLRFVVEAIMNSLQIANQMRRDILNTSDVNMNKYISFIKFENKLRQLDNVDLRKLHQYIRQTSKTMRAFRKYVKSEEISYSKRYQIAEIYERAVQDVKWCSLVLILVYFYETFYGFGSPKDIFSDVKQTFKKNFPENYAKAKKTAKEVIRKAPKNQKADPGTTTGTTAENSFQTALGTTALNTRGGATQSDSQREQSDKREEGERKNGESASTTTPQNSSQAIPGFTFEKLQNEIINFAAVIVAWGIISVFFESYLIKYKADINYDKVTNVTNTAIFEVELGKIDTYFNTYMSDKNSKNCKALYMQLIKVIEAYEKCNFVKGSFKRTPFPVTEMLTNGLIFVMCVGVFYVAYTGTGMNVRSDNAAKLKRILESIQNIDEETGSGEIFSQLQAKWEKLDKKFKKTYGDIKLTSKEQDFNTKREKEFKRQLKKFLERVDANLTRPKAKKEEMKKLEADTRVSNESVDSFVDSISNPEKRKPYHRKIIYRFVIDLYKMYDKTEGSGDNFANIDGPAQTTYVTAPPSNIDGPAPTYVTAPSGGANAAQAGGNIPAPAASENSGVVNPGRPVVGTPMAVNTPLMSTGMVAPPIMIAPQNDVTVQQELLKKYSKQRDMLSAQLVSMSRDTGYVNFVLAGSILVFGFYFWDRISRNTNRYKRLMSSGGTYTRNCLYEY